MKEMFQVCTFLMFVLCTRAMALMGFWCDQVDILRNGLLGRSQEIFRISYLRMKTQTLRIPLGTTHVLSLRLHHRAELKGSC